MRCPQRENVIQTRERAGKSYLDRRRIAKPLGHERPRILRYDSMASRHTSGSRRTGMTKRVNRYQDETSE
ncbi:protein of unknown function [Candidatus Nitrospira inopinata]|uniref:Uncharacterized protein n=1 Tax=Candidatus Nitrospira inopinata TaxID=1715989 RepID=A0A0S4KT42_9BACT|nr:protein of unknown function [Candidatus Nitrospira inopinata]